MSFETIFTNTLYFIISLGIIGIFIFFIYKSIKRDLEFDPYYYRIYNCCIEGYFKITIIVMFVIFLKNIIFSFFIMMCFTFMALNKDEHLISFNDFINSDITNNIVIFSFFSGIFFTIVFFVNTKRENYIIHGIK